MPTTARRRRVPLIAAVVAVAAALAPATAATAQGPVHGSSSADVYIRDHSGDLGAEPNTSAPHVYTSPDIAVCDNAAPCPGENPIVGDIDYVFVTLNNDSATEWGHGTLKVYYTSAGGGAQWSSHWTPIGEVVDLDVPPGGTVAMVPWFNVPGPGHFCLLARWESADDPMTFAEGTDTLTNTRNNNNIAWRNVDSVELGPEAASARRPYSVSNPFREQFVGDIAFRQPEARFGGRILLDLGPALFARWQRAGGQAAGVKRVGETQLEIVDPAKAVIKGIAFAPGERFDTNLTFVRGAAGKSVIRMVQTDARGKDIGGVEYRIVSR